MGNLSWLSKWYADYVCKSTNNALDINISTTTKSAWKVSIDLHKTKYEKIILSKQTQQKSDYNWYKIEIKEKIFLAEGDFTKLDFLIGKFREIIGENIESKYGKDDFFFDKKIQNFIFEEEEESIIFLHYTHNKKTAEKIIKTGLEYTYAFDKTATKVKNNPIDLSYNHYVRKQFGENIIIISISKTIYQLYLDRINNSSSSILRVEELLIEKDSYFNEESECIYTLHHKYIKGFINYKNNEVVKNPEFNPNYDSEDFLKNLN